MFHYRWAFAADVAKAAAILPRWFAHRPARGARRVALGTLVRRAPDRAPRRRRLERDDRAVIEESYRRLLRLLDAHLDRSRASCWAGGPARADFALFGQLTQLAGFDPTPTRRRARRRRRASSPGSTSSRTSPASSRPTRDWLTARRRARHAARAARRGRPRLRAVPARQRRRARARRRARRVHDRRPAVGAAAVPVSGEVSRAGCARATRRSRADDRRARRRAARRHGLRARSSQHEDVAVTRTRRAVARRAVAARSALGMSRDGYPGCTRPACIARITRSDRSAPRGDLGGRARARRRRRPAAATAEHRRHRRRRPRLQRPHLSPAAASRTARCRRRTSTRSPRDGVQSRRRATPATRPARRRARRS